MTTHDDAATTRALQRLDAADQELDGAQRDRAAATLERILADPVAPERDAAWPSVPGRRRPRARRLLLAGGVVVAATVVAVPVLTGGSEAFASWSPTPVELTGAGRAAAVDACLVLQGGESGGLALDPTADASVLVAEARGGWSYVLFTVAGLSQPRLEGSCLMPDDVVADPVPGEGGFFGSLGGADDVAGPAPTSGATLDQSGTGVVVHDSFVYAEGRAASDVTAIELTTPGGRRVQASLRRGHWAVWWPAGNSGDDPGLTQDPTYQVTLRDGTVVDDVRRAE